MFALSTALKLYGLHSSWKGVEVTLDRYQADSKVPGHVCATGAR